LSLRDSGRADSTQGDLISLNVLPVEGLAQIDLKWSIRVKPAVPPILFSIFRMIFAGVFRIISSDSSSSLTLEAQSLRYRSPCFSAQK